MRDLPVDGLMFPEGPRWRDGTWWLSDQLGGRILRVSPDGDVETVAEVDHPSGLGFLPDGALLAARMHDASLVRIAGGEVREAADLRPTAAHLNDMYVDPAGRAYVDAYGDMRDQATHRLLLVDQDGTATSVADDLAFPNGIAVTPDGATLIVSETFANRLTAFDVAGDGTLDHRRVWAPLPDVHPDGLCLDEAGGVWVASYLSGELLHVHVGGEILQRLSVPGRWVMACSLGGDDGRTLLVCTAETSQRDYFAGRASGHLATVRVEVPGVGRP